MIMVLAPQVRFNRDAPVPGGVKNSSGIGPGEKGARSPCYRGGRSYDEVAMAHVSTKKGVIAILTGGGDVPGLNPAIRAVTIRAIREGYQVIGIRRGWAGLTDIIPDPAADNSENFEILSEEIVDRVGRTGGTFLHTSRVRPSHVPRADVPAHLRDRHSDDVNDLTEEVLRSLDYLGVDYLIPIGGDDTLSYSVHLYKKGVKVVAIPKTMDNDVPGTDYCIGFSTCVTRTIMMANYLRTSAGSHERFLVLEVFGRYAGFTAMLPTMAGAANRCVIPEHTFDIEQLAELLSADRAAHPSNYSIVIVSEGAMFEGGEMVFQSTAKDAYGHMKLGGVGDLVSAKLKELSPKFNRGQTVSTINQRLGYLVRGGDPDAIDSIVPMAYGTMALDLILKGVHGRLVVLKHGRYDDVPVDVVTSSKKSVNVEKHYHTERLRPQYKSFGMQPLFIMTSD
jgi:6-phosphofructokinase 1